MSSDKNSANFTNEKENVKFFEKQDGTIHSKKVNLNDLMARMQSEKKIIY